MLGRICEDCSTTNTLTWTRRALFSLTIAFAIAGSTFASEFMREICALARSGLGVLFTTYDPNHALRAADRAYLLRGGQRLAEGPVREMLTRKRLEALYGASVQTITDEAAWHSFRDRRVPGERSRRPPIRQHSAMLASLGPPLSQHP